MHLLPAFVGRSRLPTRLKSHLSCSAAALACDHLWLEMPVCPANLKARSSGDARSPLHAPSPLTSCGNPSASHAREGHAEPPLAITYLMVIRVPTRSPAPI